MTKGDSIRKTQLDAPNAGPNSCLSRPVLKLDWCTYEAAKFACEKWHYAGKIPKSKLAKMGVWENGQFVGVIIFGVGATGDLVKRYGLGKIEGCELVRIALTRHQTPVSRLVAIAIRMLKNQYSKLRLIVSFADPERGHHGGIYQAGGWVYTGQSQRSDEYIFLGRRWQGRSFRNSHKGMERHPRVQVVKGSSKYRYLYPLDDETKLAIQKYAKPYPKRRAASKDIVAPGVHPGEAGEAPSAALQNGPIKTV